MLCMGLDITLVLRVIKIGDINIWDYNPNKKNGLKFSLRSMEKPRKNI